MIRGPWLQLQLHPAPYLQGLSGNCSPASSSLPHGIQAFGFAGKSLTQDRAGSRPLPEHHCPGESLRPRPGTGQHSLPVTPCLCTGLGSPQRTVPFFMDRAVGVREGSVQLRKACHISLESLVQSNTAGVVIRVQVPALLSSVTWSKPLGLS